MDLKEKKTMVTLYYSGGQKEFYSKQDYAKVRIWLGQALAGKHEYIMFMDEEIEIMIHYKFLQNCMIEIIDLTDKN